MQHGIPLDLTKIDVEYSRPMSEALKGAAKAVLTATGKLIAPDGTETTLQELYHKAEKSGGQLIVVDSFDAVKDSDPQPAPEYRKSEVSHP